MPEEKIIYHYLNVSKKSYQLLINQEFYLTPPKEFNDPFDSSYIGTLQGTEKEWLDFLKEIHKQNNDKNIEQLIKDEWYILKNLIQNENHEYYITDNNLKFKNGYEFCLIGMAFEDYYNEDTHSIFQEFNSKSPETHKNLAKILKLHTRGYDPLARAACFSERNNHTLMWSHYANNHTGIALGFKCKVKDKNNILLYNPTAPSEPTNIRKVEYEDKADRSINFLKDADAVQKSTNSLYYKSAHWKYEKEWRMIEYAENKDASKFIPFKADDLKEIIFGLRCPQKDIATIQNLIEKIYTSNNNPVFYKMSRIGTSAKIEPKEITSPA